MQNELLDDPMDTGAPAAEAAAADEPLPPAHGIDREVTPKPAGNPDLMQQSLDNPAIPMHLIEKRDDRRESCDDGYSLTVNESAIDIESLACSYDSNAFFLRARFIARHCPILRADAYISLINYLKEHTTDITHYVAFFNELESELARKEFKNRQLNFQIPLRDQKWIEENGATWQSTTDQLQAEYKRHKDEGVKESTRRAMEDLFQHYMMAGKIDEAIRLYSRGIRDYCTQLKHSINMWINWMEVAICANDWGKLDTVTNTAYRSLKDADDAEKNSQQSQQAPPQRGENAPYMVERDPNAPIQTLTNRQLIETALAKCLAAQVLLKLRNKRYSQVVETILQIKTECLQSKWFVTSSDLGIYGMLSAMATMSRADLKLQVSGNGTFRKLLESEPQLIELLGSYTSSRFGRCFEIMRSVKPRLLLDPFISRNVDELFEKIRQKCVLQYLQPYSTIKMATMAEAVGMSSAELQLSLLELIEQKHVSLKIDQNEGIVRILDERDENAILKRVNVTCDRATQKAKSLLWKTTLAGANIHSISDKETRPKRKNQKESAKFDRNFGGIDVDEDPRGIAGPSGLSDDFNIAYDQQPQQQVFTDYQQDGSATDYETYQQQQQQYRAAQASQQSSSMYYQNQMTAAQANYFPIHSASEHDFLGPQQPPSATTSVSGAAGAPYQSASGGNKEFMMQHQQRRGNQSGQQQQNQPSQQNNQQQQNQGARQQHPQQMQQQQQSNQSAHFMHQQLQAVQQQQAQQMHHRLQGAPINPQQFMVPPPTMMQPQQMQQAQQQQAQQMHQMQIHHQQHPQMMQQHAQQGYHPHQQNQQHQAGQHQQSHHQSQNHNQHRNHNQSHSGPHHIPQNLMMPRCMLKDWPIRCVVEGKYHAVIIGPNGSTIKDIASSTRCRVDFVNLSKKERTVLGNNDRILTVHGVAEQATKAVARILDVIQSEAVKDDVNVGADTVLRMRAHNQLCGRLIGKAGSSIKEIMQKTGTNITVTKYIEPPGGISGLTANELLGLMERTIMVRGPSIEAVVQAEALISAKLKKCYESDSQLRAQSMQCPMPPMMMPPILPPGASSSAVSAPHFIPTPVGVMQVQHFASSQHLVHQNANNSFLQPGVLQIQPGTTNLRQVRMWVPDSMIGALIGAKGKNIKMIIRDTGASVKIEAPEEKTQREAEEAEKKRKLDETDSGCEGVASGDHPQEFLEDNATINSSDAIEEKPKPVSERMVTINGDDLQLLKAQSYVFSKIAETSSSLPSSGMDGDRSHMLRIRTEVSVPTRIIGRIIGKGGQNVRELQRITGAVVKIPEEERNGGEVYRHDDGLEEDMTMIRTIGNMYSTHNVQFRLAHLVNEYYRSGDHRNKSSDYKGGRPHSAPSSGQEKDGSALEKMDQLGTIAPISNSNRASPKSVSPPKSKSP